MNEHEKPQIDFMHKLARQIVERRNLVFLFVILAAIFTVFSVRWVKVETDMTTYLPKTSETRMGLDIMDEQFTTYGSADVMVANITPTEADELSDRLTELKGVQMLDYDDTTDHYNKDSVSALYSITFDYPEDDDQCLEALDRVKEYLADYDIDFEALIGPMMYNSIDEYSYVCQSDLVKNMCQKLEDNYGIHVLALDFNVGMRCMQTNKVIKTPADLKGMKIRVPNSSMYINCLTAMGATPTGMPFAETISAVQQGVIDGLEGNMNAYSTNGSAEVCKNMSLTNHLVGTCGAYISSKVWNSIPEEYRTIIQEEFTKGAKELTDFTNASFDETKAKLEKEQGCSFNEVDVDAFRAAVQPEYDRMVKEDGVTAGFYDQVQAILAEYRQANK